MSYPIGWDLVNITGTYIGRNGVPCVGSVTLSSPQLVLRSGTIVPAADIVFDLVNGAFSGQIPATDDPNANPSGWTYTVTENVPGGRQGIQIVAPHTSPGIDLSTVVPVTMPMPPTFGFPYVTLSQLAGTAVGDGAYLIGYQLSATGSSARTVQAKLQETVFVEDFGAVGDGVTPDDTAIANAIAYLAGLHGGTLRFGPKTYAITQTIVVTTSNIFLQGSGSNVPHDGGSIPNCTTLKWTAVSAGTMAKFESPAGAGNGKQCLGGMTNFVLDGASIAATGLYVHSWRSATFSNLFVLNVITAAFNLSCYIAGTLAESSDTQLCMFVKCSWRMIDSTAVQNADGIVMTSDAPGTAGANTSFNTFVDCAGENKNGSGFHLIDADNNKLFSCSNFMVGGGTGFGCLIAGAYSNYWYGWSGSSRVLGTASGAFANAIDNCFDGVDDANGSAYPTVDAGCQVQWHSSKYGWVNLQSAKAVIASTQAEAYSELANLGNDTLRVRNDSQSGISLTDGTSTYTFSQDASHSLRLTNSGGTRLIDLNQGTTVNLRLSGVGFFGTTPVTTKPTVTGAKGGNAALASLMTTLAALGLVTDSTT